MSEHRAQSVNAEMLEAIEDALDDMGDDGDSVCYEVKEKLQTAFTHAQAALREGNRTTGSDDPLVDLVERFSVALLAKLQAARTKYGHGEGWRDDNWEDDCQRALLKHLAKGDPRDVAAYCAFMWHHGWSTTPSPSPPTAAVDRKAIAKIICKSHPRNDCVQDEDGRSPCDAKNCYYISVADSIIALLNGGRHEG